jgi:hypothetical protein
MPGSPPEVREGRKRMTTTTVANIKKIEGECTKLCEENAQVWTELIEDPEMKVVEAKLREVQEHAQQAAERVATLPPVECMSSILAQRQAQVEVEKMRDQQKILQQRLGPLQEEAVWVIGELAMVQGRVKQAMIEARGQTYKLDRARSRGDNNNRGHNHQRGRGGKGCLSKLHFGMEEKETGLSGLG